MNRWAKLSDGAGQVVHLDVTDPDNALVGLAGWYGGAGARIDRTARLADGMFPSPTKRDGRKLTLAGLVQRNTGQEIERFARTLSGLFPPGDSKGSLLVENSTGVLEAVGVEPDGEPRIDANLDYGWCEFELPLYCPDPVLYGPAAESTSWVPGTGVGLEYPLFDDGGGVTTNVLEYGGDTYPPAVSLANTGNTTAYPLVEVVGDLPAGFTLHLAGDGPAAWGVTYAGAVSSVSPVLVDMAGHVSVNGVGHGGYLTRRDWGGVRPGGQVVVTIIPTSGGTGSAQAILRPAYL